MQYKSMHTQTGATTLHPVMWVAAIALTAFSIVGIGKQMGWIGAPASGTDALAAAASSAETTPASTARDAEEAVEKPKTTAPARKAAPAQHNGTRETTPAYSGGNARTVLDEQSPDRVICADCGVVSSVRTVEVAQEATGAGAVAGGVVGGVLGNQVGKGSGNTAATVAGALLGGIAGHKIEQNVRTKTRYEVTVRMDDGSRRVLMKDQAPVFREGEAVRVNGKEITARSNAGEVQRL